MIGPAACVFEIVGPAVPELPFVIGGVPQAGGAAAQHVAAVAVGPDALPAKAHAQLAAVGKAVIGMMAMGARHVVLRR